MLRRSRVAAPLDADLVAVAPFDVPDARLALWREGLVDVLSRNLDGAGPLRSVPPTTVIRRWSGRADRPSAAALGRRTGARLVVFGSLIGAGPDSARLTVTALDVADDRPLADLELRDAADRVDRLADSLTVRLLRELGRTRRIEVFRTTAMGSTSLPALKAFLRGEQWFRRASWDSALASYDAAIALDSMFPLPLWRSGLVLGWSHEAGDSVSVARVMRAGTLTHGLAPRDSLRITADSILAGLYRDVPRVSLAAIQRVHAIAEDLTRRYPDDAESWYLVGEARFHWGPPAGHTPREALEAFDRAIRLDSSFAPAYIHAVALALWLDGPEAGHRYAAAVPRAGPGQRFGGGHPAGGPADGAPGRRGPVNTDSLLRAASPSALRDARLALGRAADSAEAVSRSRARSRPLPRATRRGSVRPSGKRAIGALLLYRGHVREAAKILFRNPAALPVQLVEAALVSTSLPEGADAVLRGMLGGDRLAALSVALPWWAARGDSATIRRIERTADSVARAASNEVNRGIGPLRRGGGAGLPRAHAARHDHRDPHPGSAARLALCAVLSPAADPGPAPRGPPGGPEGGEAAGPVAGRFGRAERGALDARARPGGGADGRPGEGDPLVPGRSECVAARGSGAAAVRGGGAGGIGEDDQRAEVGHAGGPWEVSPRRGHASAPAPFASLRVIRGWIAA